MELPIQSLVGTSMESLVEQQLRRDSMVSLLKSEEIGPLVRVGPNHLLTDDPDTTIKLLAARSPYVRGGWYDSLRLDPHRPNLVAESDPQKHNALRHQMSAGVSSFRELTEFSAQQRAVRRQGRSRNGGYH